MESLSSGNELVNRSKLLDTLIALYNSKKDLIFSAVVEAENEKVKSQEKIHDLHSVVDIMQYKQYRTKIEKVREQDIKREVSRLEKELCQNAWWAFYEEGKMHQFLPPSDNERIRSKIINDPEPFTAVNVKKVFGDYVQDPWGALVDNFMRIFMSLDPIYKSHDAFKIGKNKLPKRIILNGSYGYSHEKLGKLNSKVADVVAIISQLRDRAGKDKYIGTSCNGYASLYSYKAMDDYIDNAGNEFKKGLRFKRFKNGNCHIYFDSWTLDLINRCLHDYYGDLIPDVDLPDDDKEYNNKKCNTVVSKDLQFYPTPKSAIEWCLHHINHVPDHVKVLEPSCGTGNIMEVIRDKYPTSQITGVEYHSGRANECREKGFNVYTENFLEWDTQERFDWIFMNPPFYGTHYEQHVRKAITLLKEGGILHAILPITARDGHGEKGHIPLLDIDVSSRHEGYSDAIRYGAWLELPPKSFAESGTNINTVLFKYTHETAI